MNSRIITIIVIVLAVIGFIFLISSCEPQEVAPRKERPVAANAKLEYSGGILPFGPKGGGWGDKE